MSESAFIVPVPEAEPHVATLRARHDPAAALGIPAHVTILFPFMAPNHVTDAVLARARAIIALAEAFAFALADVRRFPQTLYLAPEPAEPFIGLTEALVRAFPEYPPYGGAFATVVPHVTVAHGDEGRQADSERELRSSLARAGRISARCSDVVLIENSSGRWQRMHAFPLGRARTGKA